MTRWRGALLLTLLIWAAAQGSAPGFAAAGPPSLAGQVRAVRLAAPPAADAFTDLAAHGLNVCLAPCSLDPGDPFIEHASLLEIGGWVADARRARIALLPVLEWAGEAEAAFLAATHRRWVTATGERLPGIPCPADPRHWKHALEARALALGDLEANHAPLGVVLGVATQGESTDADLAAGCYCDDCWRSFVSRAGPDAPLHVPARSRGAWVREHGRGAIYLAHQEARVASLAAGARDAIHREHPALRLGFLPGPTDWFTRALAAGLGTPALPAIHFSAEEPSTASASPPPDDGQPEPDAPATGVRVVPGLEARLRHPLDLAALIYEQAISAGGYWLPRGCFLEALSGLPEHCRLPAPAEEYREAVREANAELDRLAAAPAHVTHLVPGPQRPVFFPVSPEGMQIPALEPLDAAPPAGFLPEPVAHLRGEAVVYLRATRTGPARLRLSSFRRGPAAHGLAWLLADTDGVVLVRGTVAPDHTEEFEAPLTAGNLYALVGNAGDNEFTVNAEGCHQAYAALPVLTLSGHGGPAVHFLVPRDVRQFSVLVQTPRGGAPVRAVVLAPTGEVTGAAAGSFRRLHAIQVDVPPGLDGRTWRLQVAPVERGAVHEVGVAFSPEIPPTLADAPDRLLIPPQR